MQHAKRKLREALNNRKVCLVGRIVINHLPRSSTTFPLRNPIFNSRPKGFHNCKWAVRPRL